MKIKIYAHFSLIIVISLFIVSYALAQAGRGQARIGGVIVDEDGNSIKSAKIVIHLLKNENVKRETMTDKKGEWAILGLGTGEWRVRASADGYIPTYIDIYVRQLERNPKITLTLKKIHQPDKGIIKDEASLNLLEKANQLFTEKKYDEAIALLEQFIEENPDVYQIHLNIGDCYREKGEFIKAKEEYNRVLEHAQKDDLTGKETSAKALANIGELY